MPSFDLQHFIKSVNQVVNVCDLESLLTTVSRDLGFDYVVMASGQYLRGKEAGNKDIAIIDYPDSWIEMVYKRRYLRDDPIVSASRVAVAPFLWSQVGSIIDLTDRQREIMEMAQKEGMEDGLAIPFNLPGAIFGLCCFAVRPGRLLAPDKIPMAQYVASLSFEAARRIGVNNPLEPIPCVKLTSRQIDCLILVARGKSDSVIGQLLGISQLTVHQHIEDAKKRYGVATRSQLIVKSLYDNVIVFDDILY